MKAAPMMDAGHAGRLAARRAPLLGDAATPITRVHSDTRTLQPGDLFVALRGERFDGHDFLPQARAAGAAAALAERGCRPPGWPGSQVADSAGSAAAAGRRLARASRWPGDRRHRQQWQDHGDADGRRHPARWHGRGGVRHAGQPQQPHRPAAHAAARCAARPPRRRGRAGHQPPGRDRAAGPAGGADGGAGQQRAARAPGVPGRAGGGGGENGSVIAALPVDGRVVLPAADAMLPLWRRLAGARAVTTFALDDGSDAAGPAVAGEHPLVGRARWQGAAWALELHTPQGRVETTVPVAGRHNALNAVAAAACALELGVPPQAVAQGLAAFQPVAGRSRTLALNWQAVPRRWSTTPTTPTPTR
jgi:hypothetical protein